MTKLSRIFFPFALLIALGACNTKGKQVKEYPKKIIGRWQLMKQTSITNVLDGGAQKDTLIVDETKRYKDFAYKPAEVEYGLEGGYLLVLKDYNDEIKLRRPGLWKFDYDTLVYMDRDSTITDRYVVEITDSTMTLKGTIDFDDDGKADDSYEGFYRKLIR